MRLPFFHNKDTAKPAPKPAPLGDEAAVQAARVAARRRLIGALVLLLLGVVGFPLLFETQPRPLPSDTPILAPEGGMARVATPAPLKRPVPALPPDAGTEAVVAAASEAAPASVPAAAPSPPAAPASRPVERAPKAAVAAAAAAPAPKPAAVAAPPKPEAVEQQATGSGRFVVQVGAYNDAERMKAARQKVEKAGFKSYTQDVDTPSGKRTRVRAGPFTTRQDAEAAAGKLKAAGLQANVLAL
jgi:DedD protein